jgi:NAD(P)-dependent dehydrogenase (short-subunit alcohol dehydrogenase family)
MIAEEGGDTLTVLADVTIPADCAGIVGQTTERWGRLDILVNNVGISGTAVEVDPDAWAEAFKVDVTSIMQMAKYAIPAMIAGGGGAPILRAMPGCSAATIALLIPRPRGR